MKKHLLSQAAAWCLLAPAASLLSIPATAADRAVPATSATTATPQTLGLEVNADRGLVAGSQLRLTLEASPGGMATARIPGPNIVLPLKELSPGKYSGRYTVRPGDQIDPAAVIRVTLVAASRTVAANYSFPPSFMLAAAPSVPQAQQIIAQAPAPRTIILQSPVPTPVVVQAPVPVRIERFAVAPVGRAEAGAELLFRLDGMPGATASFDIPGIASGIPMRELRPGHYEGSYTVRSQDNLAAAGLVTATLRSVDQRIATSTLSQPLISDSRPPQIGSLSPRQGENVSSGLTTISASLDDASGAGVNPASVRVVVSGRDVTSQALVTPRELAFRAALPPGRHTVEVTAADRAGNVTQKSWSFDVGSSVMGAPSQVLPLLLMSPANNATVDPQATVIRGRTAPGAIVRIRVDAVAPALDRRFNAGVAEQMLTQAIQADANGDFSFTFNPRSVRDNATSLPIPGTRYEVSITANRDNQNAETRLMLFQRS